MSATLPEQWRSKRKLTYQQVADLWDLAGPSTAQRYCRGVTQPPTHVIETARATSGGVLTAESFHQARLAHEREKAARSSGEAAPSDAG